MPVVKSINMRNWMIFFVEIAKIDVSLFDFVSGQIEVCGDRVPPSNMFILPVSFFSEIQICGNKVEFIYEETNSENC